MSRLAWRLPSAEDARLSAAGYFCPLDTPLLVARHHVPAADALEARARMPPGESSAGGTQSTPVTTRCEAHGLFGSCVLPAACRDPRSLAARCADVVAATEERLGACACVYLRARGTSDTRAQQPSCLGSGLRRQPRRWTPFLRLFL
jgi:hypothetical protein